MKIKAVGINRAETLHRMGKYPINKEVEKYLGLEASGEVIDPATKYVSLQNIGKFCSMELHYCQEGHTRNMPQSLKLMS
jgi:threonine dehydrogenase-like Zn-dependent dehydrogenase